MKLIFDDELKGNRSAWVISCAFAKCFSGGDLSGDETKELFKAFGDCLEAKRKRECSNINEYRRIERNNADYQFYVELISRANNGVC